MLHGNEIKYSLNILTENIIKYMRYLQFVLVSNHCLVSLPTENWIEKKIFLEVQLFFNRRSFLSAINLIIKFCLLFGLNQCSRPNRFEEFEQSVYILIGFSVSNTACYSLSQMPCYILICPIAKSHIS